MTYADVSDVQARMSRDLTEKEQEICIALLEDAAVIIDAYNAEAGADAKKTVTCRMIIRSLGDGEAGGFPVGSSQGSMSAMGYSQSWTISGGGTGELYLGKLEKKLLGSGNRIGSYSPAEALAAEVTV